MAAVGTAKTVSAARRLMAKGRSARSVAVLTVAAALAVGLAVSARAGMSHSTFEAGTDPFPNVECPNPDSQFQRVRSPVREGEYAAKFSETAADVWLNGSVRCLVGNYNSGETVGDNYFYRLSIFIPASGLSRNLIWELHHPYSLYSISPACSVAPHALFTDGTQLLYRLFAGNCRGSSWATQLVLPIPHLNPYPRNVWIDFVFHIRFEESASGLVEIYYRTGSKRWPVKPLLVRSKVPTMPYSDANGVHGVKLYTMLGLYPGYSDYSGSDSLYIDDVRRETSLGAAERGGGTTSSGDRPVGGCRGSIRCGIGAD